jgi:hypothetical protein
METSMSRNRLIADSSTRSTNEYSRPGLPCPLLSRMDAVKNPPRLDHASSRAYVIPVIRAVSFALYSSRKVLWSTLDLPRIIYRWVNYSTGCLPLQDKVFLSFRKHHIRPF